MRVRGTGSPIAELNGETHTNMWVVAIGPVPHSTGMDNCDIVRRFTEEAWGRGDLSVVDELVAPDAVPPHGTDVGGPEGYKAEIMNIRNAISELPHGRRGSVRRG